jgi:hypothetical protein
MDQAAAQIRGVGENVWSIAGGAVRGMVALELKGNMTTVPPQRHAETAVSAVILSLLMLISLSAVLLCSGCAGTRPQSQYAVQGFTLIVMEQQAIRQQYKTMYGKDIAGINGYCDQEARVIFCDWNDDRTSPDFEHLGHEVWHLNELGGRYHK